MNAPPESGIRVPAEALRTFVTTVFEKAGTTREHAEIMALLMVRTDLRGTFSHGTRYTSAYVHHMLSGDVNPRPDIRVVHETTTTQVLDGDGGMGHWPCYQGTQWAIARAREHGTAAVTTRNHHHFGAASKYSCMALEQDCIGLAVSTHRSDPSPEGSVLGTHNSPLSYAVPTGDQPPVVPDHGMNFLPVTEELFEAYPKTFYRMKGMSLIPKLLGGVLAGIDRPECMPPQSRWESSQGGFIAVFDVASFMDVDEFKRGMDALVGAARRQQPAPGHDRAHLPGGPEQEHVRDFSRDGIPLSPEHQEGLEKVAARVGVDAPFADCEHTRFGP